MGGASLNLKPTGLLILASGGIKVCRSDFNRLVDAEQASNCFDNMGNPKIKRILECGRSWPARLTQVLWSCHSRARELPSNIFRFSVLFSPKHLASRHYLSPELSAFVFGLGLQAF